MRKKLFSMLALLCLTAAGAWAQTEQTVDVTPVTGQTNQWTLTMPAGNVVLNVEYEPTYAVTFAEGMAEPTLWTASPATDVEKGQTVTVTYTGAKKVIGVKAEKKLTPSLSLTNPTVGQIIGSDGKNYDANATLPNGVTAAAMIAYVSGSNGLAIALADEASLMNWSTANGETGAAAHTPVFSNGTWKLPSQDEWKQMFSANGGSDDSYTGLNTAITAAGGTALQESGYWSSTEYDGVNAFNVYLAVGNAFFGYGNKDLDGLVRAVLAF